MNIMNHSLTASKRWILASTLALVASTAPAATVTGTAVAVRDGNTFVLSSENRQITVRLKGLKAPVGREKLAKAAKAQLSNLVIGQKIRVDFAGAANSARVTGNAFFTEPPAPNSINREFVRRGFALATGPGGLRAEERRAKARKIGIHAPSLAAFLKVPAGWRVVGDADSIPFDAAATGAQRKQSLRLLSAVYAETDRLTLGRILFLSDSTLGIGGTVDVQRSTQLNLARNKNFVRRFQQVGGGSFNFDPGFNSDDITQGIWSVVLDLNAPSGIQPVLRLDETSGTDINGQPVAPEVRQFSLEPDPNAAGRILLNGVSFVSGPL